MIANLVNAKKLHTVVIVDDAPEFLEMASQLVNGHPNLAVSGTATSGEQALAELLVLRPDILIIDVNMTGIDGFETARRAIAILPQVRIIMMSVHEEVSYASLARQVGALAFITKRDLTAERIADILGIGHGDR
ncbi:MAG: response regulator transcription factor [Chloroflexi bacterium]|nr:response regulator transcription factor [Chloroflexota bacterium]